MERIGIFGGTFDPIHYGHLQFAADAKDELNLDRVLFVVAGEPWQKEAVGASAEARWLMTKAATEGIPWAEASDIEMQRTGPTYTIDTVRNLYMHSTYREVAELILLLGEDQGRNFHTWKDAEYIEKYCTLQIMDRWLNLSSTLIRQRVKNGESIEYLVPYPVAAMVATYGLYL